MGANLWVGLVVIGAGWIMSPRGVSEVTSDAANVNNHWNGLSMGTNHDTSSCRSFRSDEDPSSSPYAIYWSRLPVYVKDY